MVRKDDAIDKEPERVIDNNLVGEPNMKNKSEPKKKEIQEKPYVPPPPHQSPVLFPQRLTKSKTEGQLKKFVKLLKQPNITIPFSEAITQIPTYAKFLKEILSNKRKLDGDSTVELTEECSVII